MNRVTLLVLLSCLLRSGWTFAQWQKPAFTRLSTNEGLSQSHVHEILKDRKGFMWFATDEGLNKYDGYKFSIYKHDPNNRTSLNHNLVYDILEDKAGTLWVATGDGLDKFDRERDTFSHYDLGKANLNILDIFQDSKQRMWLGTPNGLYLLDFAHNSYVNYKTNSTNTTALSNNYVTKITEDETGNLWIATHNGLNRFNPQQKRFDHYFHDPQKPGSLSNSWLRTVYKDQKGTIWAGTLGGGVVRYNPASDSFTNFQHNASDPFSIGHNDILALMDDNQGNLWIGSENGGISIYNPTTNRFTTVSYEVADNTSLSNNSVYCIYKDDIGNIWAGTYSGGINFYPKYGRKFKTYRSIQNQNSLNNNIILSIQGDDDGYIWIGTDGGGLNRFDRKTNTFSVFNHKPSVCNSPNSDYVISVVYVEKDLLALGYHRTGFDLFDTRKGIFTHYTAPKDKPNNLPTYSVNSMNKDRANNLWIGTWDHGLYYYNRATKQLINYAHEANNPNSLCNNNLDSILEDESGQIWIGTENGLDCLDRATNTFTHYTSDPKNSHTIGSNTVNALVSAGKDYLWVGTSGGLCLLNKKTKRVDVISEKDGLPNNVINAIVKDLHDNLWISTNKGISRYNIRTKTIRNYGISDGIQGNEFKAQSAFRAGDGTLFFGGAEGFNTFHPDSMADNTYVPPVYITDFQIFNKSVHVGEPGSPLTRHISETKQITLSSDQGVFSLEFAALNYTLPQKNQYAYKLEGFDKDWNYIGSKRSATYTNLDPGNYTFRVKASNNDGVWNKQGAAITFTILPPYWKTWWFRLIIISIVLGSAYAFYKVRINAVQAQKWALERIVEERTERLKQEQILNKMKSQFVSTASHEFRTPLATIQSSIDLVDMYLDFPPDNSRPLIKKHLGIVEKEIGKFGDLLDDVLTIEKINAGKVLFVPKEVDLLVICEDVIATHFQVRKDHRHVELSTSGQPRLSLLDEKLINHALVNLLSNAFKFSTTNPALSIDFGEQVITMSVSDQGIGIPAKDLPNLFKTFFRAENVSTIQGTGLGLFITKQAVELHKGTIRVQTEENVGTTFTITLPA